MEESYDPVQAKFCASLLWFVCRVSENGHTDIPQEITSPIEITATNSLIVRPAVVNYLTSGTMYMSVGSLLFLQEVRSLWDLIQLMSRNGVYVLDENEDAVSDLDLMERFPFKLFSHLSLMDALMTMYLNNKVTIQHIVDVVRNFSTYNASKELPFDLEDAFLLWINKVNLSVENNSNRSHQQGAKKFRQANDLKSCLRDSKMLLSLFSFYFPDVLNMNDIKLGKLTTEEHIDNTELFRSLCAEYVCTSVFTLRVDDFIYANEHLKTNFMVLLCEMFHQLEISKPTNKRPAHNIAANQIPPNSEEKKRREDISKPSRTPHQPLLSKRSKQQFAKFDTEKTEDTSPQETALMLDDFDLKQSYTVESTTNTHHPEVSQAWEKNRQDGKTKKQMISVNFRPDQPHNVSASLPQDVSSNPKNMRDSYSRRTADYVHAVSQDTHLAENFDFNMPPKTFIDVLYEGAPKRMEEFSKANSVAREPLQSWSAGTSNTLPPDDAVKQDNCRDHQDDPYIDDDALSTITEATEPDAPSLYSFRSSSSSTSTKVSDEKNEHGTIQRTDKNLNGNINVFHQHQAVLASVSPNTTLTSDTASHTNHTVLSCDMDTRGSYTVNRGTVEAAVATGLPIITDSVKRSLYQPLTRMDATSTMEEYDETSEIPIRYESGGVLSAGNNSDFEDAPIHIASGSSSGLSTDDGIGHAVSDTDESTRPSNVVYSSLSEHMSPLSPNVHARLEPFAGYDELRDQDENEETLVESVKTSFAVDNEPLHSSVAEIKSESIPMNKTNDPKLKSRTERILKDFSNTSRKIDIQVSYKHWPFSTTKNSTEQTKIKFHNNLSSTGAPITWFDLVQNNVNKNESKLKEMFEQMQSRKKHNKSAILNWADLVETTREEEHDEPLTARLAALRMQLEEKRRQFEEEKKKKQLVWSQERAKNLQDAFFVVIGGKENKDPMTTQTDVSSWEVHFNEVNQGEGKTKDEANADKTPTKKKQLLSPREFIRRKQQENKNKPATDRGLWFVDFDEDKMPNTNIDEMVDKSRVQQNHDAKSIETPTEENNKHDTLKQTDSSPSLSKGGSSVVSKSINTANFKEIPHLNDSRDVSSSLKRLQALNESTSELVSRVNRSDELENTEENVSQAEKNTSKLENDDEKHILQLPEEEEKPTTYNEPPAKVVTHPVVADNPKFYPDEPGTVEYVEDVTTIETYIPDERLITNPPDVNNYPYAPDQSITPVQQKFHSLNINEELPHTSNLLEEQNTPVKTPFEENTPVKTLFEQSTPVKTLFEQNTPNKTPLEQNTYFDTPCNKNTPNKAQTHETRQTPGTPESSSFAFTFGDEMMENPGLTPEQLKKKERFLKNRVKRQEAELEKKRKKEEKLVEQKLKKEAEERRLKEQQMEEQLVKATNRLHQDTYSKRIHELTYNTDINPAQQRRNMELRAESASPTVQQRVEAADDNSSSTNSFSEYKGPAVYQKPSGKSNKKIIQNAIMHCCLSGEVNKEAKKKCVEAIFQSEASHFLVLFREGLKFRSVYEYRPESETVTRIYGIGPKNITPKMMNKFFKYNSGAKEFNALDTKHLSIQIDGLMIKKELWEKKSNLASKTNSNFRKKPPTGSSNRIPSR
ncbi:calmodulin-regulated spectrin-associated protein 1-B-like isoform X2 [Hydractinia symbiolongicarpus]|uniref:calmodulin-regulated spectrin-associated protein 1-B-like isoform X2 n=1 Tax=Hydractinia symbiolongicarpus TaxID=13093 RepID=UPI00254B527F|nr:calmodulin-regulated spectrin-associated protein 1-B-like isoform X2 [Hydractinia symbiolongicarpus]